MSRIVRDDALSPDPGFAELYASLPEATEIEPWLSWARRAQGPVLYLGVGGGRLAAPLRRAGITLVGVDSHPGMLALARSRAPGIELVERRIEDLALGRKFQLVIAPSNILYTSDRVAAARRHLGPGGRMAIELMNPHWLAAGGGEGVSLRDWTAGEAAVAIDYGGLFVQEARFPLVWPEDVEVWLERAGLRLLLMRGSDRGPIPESRTFYIVAELSPGDGEDL